MGAQGQEGQEGQDEEEEEDEDARRRAFATPCAPTEVNSTLEDNVYGFVAMPSNLLGLPALVLLLAVHLSLVFGLTLLIDNWVMLDVRAQKEALRGSVDPMCRLSGETWDCTPQEIKRLWDFDALDLDGDGAWSSAEARDEGLLEPFHAIHAISLEQQDLLEAAFPPQPPVPDYFCGFVGATVYLHLLSVRDVFEMLETSGRVTDSVLTECSAEALHAACGPGAPAAASTPRCEEPNDEGTRNCMLSRICTVSGARVGESGWDRYHAATAYLSRLPRALHSTVRQNLLTPCKIVDRDLCANKASFLETVPMWEPLPPEAKVKQCKEFLRYKCPKLLGARYDAFRVRMSTMCGDRSYEVRELGRAKAAIEPKAASYVSCADDNGKARDLAQRIMTTEFPVLKYIAYGNEMASGFPKGTTLANFNCRLGHQALQLCTETLTMVDPESPTQSRVPLGSLFARVCPATCAALRPLPSSLPPRCARLQMGLGELSSGGQAAASPSAHIQSHFGELLAFGRCELLSFGHDEVVGNIVITRDSAAVQNPGDACTMLLRSKVSVRAYVVKMDLRPREGQEATAEDTDCWKDRLEINGKRLCNAVRPKYVDIPEADHDVTLHWASCVGCSPYKPLQAADEAQEWQIQLVDAGEEATAYLKMVSFSRFEWYWSDDGRGLMTWSFTWFLFSIMTVWVIFLQKEGIAIKEYLLIILHCPMVATSRTRQMVLLLGVALPRAALWICVAWVGTALLAVSTSLVDIVLNSVALSFILDCDEYLFHAVLPWSVQVWFSRSKNVAWTQQVVVGGHVHVWRNITSSPHLHMLLKFFLVVGVASSFVAYVYWIEPGFTTSAHAVQCLCMLSGERCAMAS